MRLLNTTTLTIHEFSSKKSPKYTILSHRWEEDETSFQDACDRQNLDLRGWNKITSLCALARKWDWEYAWADTCCIDKTSSSELSEAINSMYTWYRNAEECYAYLSDVPGNLDEAAKIEALRRSKWFTRGWTLQELLAPSELFFVDSNWKIIGSKKTLNVVLSEITGIDDVSNIDPSAVSVAARMSWASKRECSREEDHAYCLMGIFGINMPLLYGEGENAFKRLQLEILKTSDDESLFAWWHPKDDFKLQTGLFATSPLNFWESGDITPYPFYPDRPPYDMTNKGLQIEACLIPCKWLLERPLSAYRVAFANTPDNDSLLMMDPQWQSSHHRHFRGDQYRPWTTSEAESLGDATTTTRIWIFPLNCRLHAHQRPVVVILAEWGSKQGQCCRLFSEKSTDESFGPAWAANWQACARTRTTRLTYIREADAQARRVLGNLYITSPQLSIGSDSAEVGSYVDNDDIEDLLLGNR